SVVRSATPTPKRSRRQQCRLGPSPVLNPSEDSRKSRGPHTAAPIFAAGDSRAGRLTLRISRTGYNAHRKNSDESELASMRKCVLVLLLVSGFALPALAADTPYLYKVSLVQAAPGKLVELIDLYKARAAAMKETGDEAPLWMRHSQGDH